MKLSGKCSGYFQACLSASSWEHNDSKDIRNGLLKLLHMANRNLKSTKPPLILIIRDKFPSPLSHNSWQDITILHLGSVSYVLLNGRVSVQGSPNKPQKH